MRRWLKLLLGIIAGAILVAVAGYVYLLPMGGLEKLAASKLNSLMEGKYPFEISIGNIGGSVFTRLTLDSVVVRFADSLGGRQLLRARQITAEYNLRGLLREDYSFELLKFDSISVLLVQDTSGRFGFPARPEQAPADSAAPLPDFAVDKLILTDCSVTLIRPSDTVFLTDVHFDASVRSELQTIAMDIHAAGVTSNNPNYNFPSVAGKLTLADRLLTTQDFAIERNGSNIRLDGVMNLKETSGEFSINADDLNLLDLEPYIKSRLTGIIDAYGTINFDRSRLSGRLSVGGEFLIVDIDNLMLAFHYHFPEKQLVLDTAYGMLFGKTSIDGKGLINFAPDPDNYGVNLAVQNFNLNDIAEGTLQTDFNAVISLEGSSFKSEQMVLNVTGDIYDSYLDEYPIQRAEGEMRITARDITFPRVFNLWYFENQFELTGMVDYRNDMNLNVRAFLNNLDRYYGKLFIEEVGGRAYAEATMSGPTKDPDLSGFLQSDSIWLYDVYADSLDVGVFIEDMFTSQKGTVYSTATNGTVFGQPYDTLFTVLAVGGNSILVDTSYLHTPHAVLTGKAHILHRTSPQQVHIDTLTISYLDQTLYNSGEIHLALEDSALAVRKGAISNNGSQAMVLGRYQYDGGLDFSVSVNDIPIKAWASLFREDFPVDGIASLQGTIGGTLRNPAFSASGNVDSLAWKDLVLGDLTAIVSYRDRILFVDSALLLSDPGIYRAHGTYNLDIDFTSDSLQFSQRPFDLQISATDRRFDLVTLLLPSVEYLAGDMYADIHLFGTPSDPHLEGAALLTGARLKYFDLVDTLYADTANFLMRDNQVVIERINVYVKDERAPDRRSYARVEGELTFKSLDNLHWDVDVEIPRPFLVQYELDDIQAHVEGDLSIQGDSPPLVTGDLLLSSARYRAEFAEEDEGTSMMTTLIADESWDFNLNVDIPSNFWIENQDIDAEFSGFLNVIREDAIMRFIGELEILRGSAPLFDKTWRIEPGSRAIYDNVAEPNPTLDITACTVIRGLAGDFDDTRENIDLCVHITGTLETPQLAVVGESGLSREDLIPYLVANTVSTDTLGAGTAFSGMEQRLTGYLSSQVSQIGTRQIRQLGQLIGVGVETFEIEPSYTGRLDPLQSRVTLGLYWPTNPNLYVYGRSSLSSAAGRELGFEYRFSKNVLLEGRRDEEELYHLNLKLHWEWR